MHDLRTDAVSLEVTERQPGLIIQVGANRGETVELFLPDARTAALGLANVSVATRVRAESALTITLNAFDSLQSSRARIGAYQNRLERAVNFIGISRENQAAADGRLRELDYADEIVKFTRDQILQQTGTSALAQANLIPSAILALLG
jgi:flagellin